jgi:hypothetical protein
MDIAALKARAVEETTRAFLERQGYAPDPDSDEWEDEYRRQFARAKAQSHAPPRPTGAAPGVPAVSDAPAEPSEWPPLRGVPADVRWATALRAERLRAIADADLRAWLAATWTAAKGWVDTRELPAPAFLRLVQPRFAEHRRQEQERAAVLEAERRSRTEAAAALEAQVRAAGITLAGLVELVDLSPRAKAAPAKAKLAELEAGDRRLRVFETANPAALLVIESRAGERTEYGIERDAGLVADLKLFAQVQSA